MGGGKHNKGCCDTNPCGFHCIQNGASPCSTRSARFYSVQFTTDREGTGSDCCNNLWGDEGFWYYKNIEGSGCTWTLQSEPGPGDCDSTLVISGSSATVTVTLGAYTLVWTSAPGYDPLCIWPFYYDAEASTPPDDCSWPTQLCVNPYEVCCPDHQFPTLTASQQLSHIFRPRRYQHSNSLAPQLIRNLLHPEPSWPTKAASSTIDRATGKGWAFEGIFQDQGTGASPGDATPCHWVLDGLCCPP